MSTCFQKWNIFFLTLKILLVKLFPPTSSRVLEKKTILSCPSGLPYCRPHHVFNLKLFLPLKVLIINTKQINDLLALQMVCLSAGTVFKLQVRFIECEQELHV